MLRTAAPAPILTMLATVLLIVAPTLSGTAPAAFADTFVRGDVNDDGLVSIADLSRLVGFVILEGEPPECYDSADIDDDGQIALNDAIWMISFLFGPTGADALPLPYPDPGLDTTTDALPPCTEVLNEPVGSELPHIYFFSPDGGNEGSFGIAPGQTGVPVPIRLDAPFPVEGLTISLAYDPAVVASVIIDFEEGVPEQYGADLRVGHQSPLYPGRSYGYVVMEFLAPITNSTFPAGSGLLIGHAWLTMVEDAPLGSVIEISFETLPPTGDEPPIRNETVIGGSGSIYPTTQQLVAPIVDGASLFRRGDTNRDGNIDISDAMTLLAFLFVGDDGSVPCLDAADIDDSGDLDLADGITLLFTLFEPAQSLRPAAPYPYQGTDPTSDSIPCLEVP